MSEGVTLHSLLEGEYVLMSSIEGSLGRSGMKVRTELYPGSVSGLEPSCPVVIRPVQFRQGRIADQNG